MEKAFPIIATLFICLLTLSAFINRPDDPIERIINLLNQISEREPGRMMLRSESRVKI